MKDSYTDNKHNYNKNNKKNNNNGKRSFYKIAPVDNADKIIKVKQRHLLKFAYACFPIAVMIMNPGILISCGATVELCCSYQNVETIAARMKRQSI